MNKIPENLMFQLLSYVRSKIEHMYDPSFIFGEPKDLRSSFEIPHKGFYIGVIDAQGNEILREGFLESQAKNILYSADNVVAVAFPQLQIKSLNISHFKTSLVHICVIHEVTYIPNPMNWDENEDGLFFQWGQKYKGFYLPYQIKRLNTHKIGVLDRLCGWECRLSSNLWRSESGLCWKLICQSI